MIVVGIDGKNQIKSITPPHSLLCCNSVFYAYIFIAPSCPPPLMGQHIMKKLDIVLVMDHLPGFLMLQNGPQRPHEIPLEVDQQVSPFTWYNGIRGRAKIAIPVKIQLKDPNHYPKCKQYPLKQDTK
jgi:hypothetical protein